jgi:hypothetical protein
MISKTFGTNHASPVPNGSGGTEKEYEPQQSRGLAPQPRFEPSTVEYKSRALRLDQSAWYVGSNKTSSMHFFRFDVSYCCKY